MRRCRLHARRAATAQTSGVSSRTEERAAVSRQLDDLDGVRVRLACRVAPCPDSARRQQPLDASYRLASTSRLRQHVDSLSRRHAKWPCCAEHASGESQSIGSVACEQAAARVAAVARAGECGGGDSMLPRTSSRQPITAALAAPLSQDDSDDGAAAHRLECPVCRLVGAWSFALAPTAGGSSSARRMTVAHPKHFAKRGSPPIPLPAGSKD